MQQTDLLSYGKFYHIYNRGIDSRDLFIESTNYRHFLNLYDKHISPVADTYAWVLMKNHFHFLVRIKEESEIENSSSNLTGFENLSGLRYQNLSGLKYEYSLKPPHQYFSNLFNAYTKAFNKMYVRHGNLFERPFKRKQIEDKEYLKTLVTYIHNNPVHHKFTEHAMDYPWSSYLTCISAEPTRLQRNVVIGWFDDEANFKNAHDNQNDEIDMDQWLGL